jgi:uncharacterized phage-like protein YoqJ
MIVSFTGHRPDKLGGYALVNPKRDDVLRALCVALRYLKPTQAISGMALGVDQWAASCCTYLRIPWHAYVPFKGQERRWPPESQATYHRVLTYASEIRIVCGPEVDPIRAMQIRNEAMVDACDLLIAVWDGTKGGTANCVRYAQLMGKRIYRIDPRDPLCHQWMKK